MARKRLQASALGILAAAMLAAADPAGAQGSSVYPTDPGGQGTTQVVMIPSGQIVTVTARSASYSNIDLLVYDSRGTMLGAERGCDQCSLEFFVATGREVRIVTSGPAQVQIACAGCIQLPASDPTRGLPTFPRGR